MTLRNDQELANTRVKLARLEALYAEEEADIDDDVELREISMESLKRLMNQLKEEIARYEAHHAVRK